MFLESKELVNSFFSIIIEFLPIGLLYFSHGRFKIFRKLSRRQCDIDILEKLELYDFFVLIALSLIIVGFNIIIKVSSKGIYFLAGIIFISIAIYFFHFARSIAEDDRDKFCKKRHFIIFNTDLKTIITIITIFIIFLNNIFLYTIL